MQVGVDAKSRLFRLNNLCELETASATGLKKIHGGPVRNLHQRFRRHLLANDYEIRNVFFLISQLIFVTKTHLRQRLQINKNK